MGDDIVARLRAGGYHLTERPVHLEAADEIERLRAAMNKILHKCPYARKDKWCSTLDCNCTIARDALAPAQEKTDG